MRGKREIVTNYAVLGLFAVIVIIPVLWLLGAALSPKRNGAVDPAHLDLQWGNFTQAWVQADFGRHLGVSLVLSVSVVAVICVISPLAAYAFAVLRIPGGRWLFPLFLAGIMIPLEGIVVPLYFDLRSYQLTGTLLGLILAQIGLSVSFGVFWMRAAFLAVPAGIIESAQLDGAGRLRTLRSVALPIVKPAVITMALLTFMWTWNDYFLAFVLVNNPEQYPVTVALGDFTTRYTTEVNLTCAAAVLLSVPVLILYVLFQRQFIQGVLSGALKG
jgi:raffinose/stachyose/melibiose transport system permease protein